MNTLRSLTIAVVVSAAVPATALAGPAVVTAQTCPVVTPSAVQAEFIRFSDAWATLDPDAVTALFTADPILLVTVSIQPG